jgi:hypothetical protein
MRRSSLKSTSAIVIRLDVIISVYQWNINAPTPNSAPNAETRSWYYLICSLKVDECSADPGVE